MTSKPGGRGFAFIDAGEAARRLGIDRVTLDQWIKEGRIKPHRGVGRDLSFAAAMLTRSTTNCTLLLNWLRQ